MSKSLALSSHFTLEEALFSSTALRLGISNEPTSPEIIQNLRVAAAGMESVRAILGSLPIHIDSWYRCGILNGMVNGSRTSAHMDGYAVDFTCSPYSPLQIVQKIIASNILFDQCIQEGKWVHISFAPAMRRKVLTAHFDSHGEATYTEGIA